MDTLPRRLASRALALALVVGIAACGDEATSVEGPGPDGSWVFVAGTVDGAALTPPAGPIVTLEVSGLDAAGQSTCNGYSATLAAASDGEFQVEQLTQTEIACEGPGNEFERVYLGALPRLERYAVDGRNLVVSGDRVELRFEVAPDLPAAALIGSEWVLDTLYDGETASVPIVAEPGRLNLRGDGVFSGFDGCQLFLGEWSPAIGTEPLSTGAVDTLATGSSPDEQQPVATPIHVVSFGVADPTAECAGGAAETAPHVRAVLGSDFTAVVTGLELRIVNAVGNGLGYHTTADGSVPAPPPTVPPLPPESGATSTTAAATTTVVPAATAAPPPAAEPTPPPAEPPAAPPEETTTTPAPATTTTTVAPTEYLASPPPSVPPVTDDPPGGALAAGTYWATLQSLAGTTATFELGKAYFGEACRERFGDDPARCVGDWDVEPGVAVPVTVDLAVATITVSDATPASYRISTGELELLLAGQPAAAGAPAGYAYTSYAYLLSVRAGLVIAAEQIFTA